MNQFATLPDSLLASVLNTPHDDTPRFVAADWYEEHGQPERAEFIRCQIALSLIPIHECESLGCSVDPSASWAYHNRNCPGWEPQQRIGQIWEQKGIEWLGNNDFRMAFVRGWPETIFCTHAQWVGESPCRSCGSFSQSLGINAIDFCLTCKGTGLNGGIAGRVMKEWPVIRVVLTDRNPTLHGQNRNATWWREARNSNLRSDLATGIFDLLSGGKAAIFDGLACRIYATESEAHAAASAAAIDFGRRQAGFS